MNFQGLRKVSTISERLQFAMDKRKIKQIDLARVADVNQGALSRYLSILYMVLFVKFFELKVFCSFLYLACILYGNF